MKFPQISVFLVFLILLPLVSANSVDLIQISLSGDVTTDILLEELTNEDFVLLGTSRGVYILTDYGVLDQYIQTSSVSDLVVMDDVNEDGRKDIVISVQDSYFPNIQAYDTVTGKKIWDFATEMEVYDMSLLWTMYQTPTFDLEVIEDTNGDGFKDVVATSGYKIYLINGKTGQELWSYESTNNLWKISIIADINGDGIDDVLTGGQNGHLYLLSGENGEVLWDYPLISGYTVIDQSTKSEIGTVERSVWDIIPIGEKVVVSGEDGKVYLVNLDSKEIEWEKEIIDYSDILLFQYYGYDKQPTSYTDQNFFNLRIKLVDDVSGDGSQDVLAFAYPGSRESGKQYKGKEQGLYLLDASNGEMIWQNKNINLNYIKDLETAEVVRKASILLPAEKTQNKDKIRVINLKDGSLSQTIEVSSSITSSRFETYVLKKFDSKKFLMASNYGNLVLASFSGGNITWSYPRITDVIVEKEDLTGDSAPDIFVKSRDNAERDNYLDEGQSRALFVINGKTNEIAWSYEMSQELFSDTGGLNNVEIGPDINRDGKPDIFSYIQYPGDWNQGDEHGEKTRIFIFSGKDGTLLRNLSATENTYYGMYEEIFEKLQMMKEGIAPQSIDRGREIAARAQEFMEREKDVKIRKRIESIDFIEDQTGDGIEELIIGCWRDVFILDVVKEETVWTRTYEHWVYENPFTGEKNYSLLWNWTENDRNIFKVLDDINGDGKQDLALASWNGITIAFSKLGTGLDFQKSKTISYANGIDRENVKTVKDMDGDKRRDIMVQRYREDQSPLYEILSGSSGMKVFEAEREGTDMRLGVADFDGDNRDDSIVFYKWSETGPKLEVISGVTGSAMWTYNEYEETWMLESMFGYERFMPAAPVEDMNGDGITDLAIVRTLPWQPGAEVVILDLVENEEIKTISIEELDFTRNQEFRWQPAITTALLSDLNGDGHKELGFIGALGESNRKEIKLIIVDIFNDKLVGDFALAGKEIIGLDKNDSIAAVGQGGNIFFLDVEKDVSITSPSTGSEVTSPLNVEWQSGEDTMNLVLVDNRPVLRTREKNATFDVTAGEHDLTVYSLDKEGKGVFDTVQIEVLKQSFTPTIISFILIVLIGILFFPTILDLLKRKGVLK